MILRNRLDITTGAFGGFSLPRSLRGLNAVANGDKEDWKDGQTEESLLPLADKASPSQGKVDRADIQS